MGAAARNHWPGCPKSLARWLESVTLAGIKNHFRQTHQLPMDSTKLKKRTRQLFRRLEKQALKMGGGFSGDNIHDLRLDFKRLRALLEMLDAPNPPAKGGERFRVFKKKYRQLGRYREAEQLAVLLEKSKRLSPERRQLAKNEIDRRRLKAKKKLNPGFFKKMAAQVRLFKKGLLAEADYFWPEVYLKWMDDRSRHLRSVDAKNLQNEAEAHDYRKLLKDFLYNLELPGRLERRD